MEDEEGEWSYSTALGSQTMDCLREWFGEASFRDSGPWDSGDREGEARPAGWGPSRSTQQPPACFPLASPKLRLEAAQD